METIEIHQLPDAYRARWVYDSDYQSEGSFAYDTEAETARAVREEIEAIERGHLVPMGCVIEYLCPHCNTWYQINSLWGIVASGPDSAFAQETEQELLAEAQR